MTLNYMSGIWVAAFLVGATLWKGNLLDVKGQMPMVLSVVISFLGVVMILRPTIEQDQVLAGLVGLFLFGDQIPWLGWGGILIIVLSGIAATALSGRNKASTPSPLQSNND